MFDGKPSYKLGEKWVSFDGEKLVDTTEFTMDLDVPSITFPVMLNHVQPNDLISHEEDFVIVKSVKEDSVCALTSSGVELTITPMANPMMGGAFVMKVVNPMAGMTSGINMGEQSGVPMMNGINPMMMMMMGDNNSGEDNMFKKMMMMQMMQNQFNPPQIK